MHQARRLHGIVATLLVKTGKLADQGSKSPEESAVASKFAVETPNQVQQRIRCITPPGGGGNTFKGCAHQHPTCHFFKILMMCFTVDV